MASQVFVVHADLSGWQLQNAVIHQVTSDPATYTGSQYAGLVAYNTATNKLRIYNGSTWSNVGAVDSVTLTQPSTGFTISNSGVAQSGAASFTFALSDDLGALEALAGSGVAVRTGTNTWNVRTISGASGITVTNGDGVAANPTISADTTILATRAYVDSIAQGIKWKSSVRAATTTAGTLASSFANGSIINSSSPVTLATGDRILIKNQAAPSENGIYTVNASGAPTRATDADTWLELVSACVFVEVGDNADKAFVCTVDQGGTLGTTAVTFVAFMSTQAGVTYTSSNGGGVLQETWSTANAGLTVNKTTAAGVTTYNLGNGSTTEQVYTSGTIVPIANGGTGAATFLPHYVLIGPSSGSIAAAPTVRAMSFGDIPETLAPSQITSGPVGSSTYILTSDTGGTVAWSAYTSIKKYVVDCGTGTSQDITHSLGTPYVQVQIWETGGLKRQVFAETRTSATDANNKITVLFNTAPTAGQYRIIVMG